jgi:predicted RNA-binding Zn-ribbon protein involved in translation (DUF1610 family)
MKIVRTRDYGTHKHSEIFSLTDYFCPHCGNKSVWEGSDNDYYRGVDYACKDCGGKFEHPCEPEFIGRNYKVTWSEETSR